MARAVLAFVGDIYEDRGAIPSSRGKLFEEFVTLLIKRELDVAESRGEAYPDQAAIEVYLVELARRFCADVEFSAEDASRSEPEYLAEVFSAVIEAGAVRFRPMLLTALAVVVGASVILADPIFQGLAISLLFGLASSTLLTVLVIPAIYIVLRDDDRLFAEPHQ
jgi:hypothetical protein